MERIKNIEEARKWLLGVAESLGYKTEYEAAREVLRYPNLHELRELSWASEILNEEPDESILLPKT